MKRIFLWMLCCMWGIMYAQELIPVGLGYSSTSVNTAVFRNSSLVTYRNSQ